MRFYGVRTKGHYPRGVVFALIIVTCLGFLASFAWADDEDRRSLELYEGEPEVVSAHRSPRPASQTAENITVVTAQEIEALNAHTLADILDTIPGVQLEMDRTPGTSVNVEVQGSRYNHVLVLIDNVPINNLTANYPDIASVPVQMIERVEVVKGAASTSWGSALGGVVNVITKGPNTERPFSGLFSGSLGKRTTADTRGEITGTVDRIGYYLSGGYLHSDGLLPNNGLDQRNAYGKLHYDLPTRGTLTLSTMFTDGSSGQYSYKTATSDDAASQESHQYISTLSLLYPLDDHLTLQGSLHSRVGEQEVIGRRFTVSQLAKSKESSNGGSVSLSWLNELQRIVAGVDYDHAWARLGLSQTSVQRDLLNRSADRVGMYLNDIVTLGSFAIIPSVRYDRTGIGESLFTPSLGVTYALTENSVLRGYTSRGYSITSLNQEDATEKVWTSQVGFETGEIPYLWLKGTLFRNDTWNINDIQVIPNPNPSDGNPFITVDVKQRQLKQGFELELKTLPVWHTSFSTCYTFIDARDGDTHHVITQIPRNTVNVGIKYQDPSDLRILLTGRYIDWNGHERNGRYDDIIWNLHLAKKIPYSTHGSVEFFLSIRNLLNGDQYPNDRYKNAGTWGEAGVRCNF